MESTVAEQKNEWWKNYDPEKAKAEGKVFKTDLWKAIRAKCVDCSAGSFNEVSLCLVEDCSLYLYRYGKPLVKVKRGEVNPEPETDAEKEQE